MRYDALPVGVGDCGYAAVEADPAGPPAESREPAWERSAAPSVITQEDQRNIFWAMGPVCLRLQRGGAERCVFFMKSI